MLITVVKPGLLTFFCCCRVKIFSVILFCFDISKLHTDFVRIGGRRGSVS